MILEDRGLGGVIFLSPLLSVGKILDIDYSRAY